MRIVQANATSEQKAELVLIDLALVLHQINAEQKGEEQLVLLEQRAANVAVQRVSEMLAQIGEPCGQLLGLLRVLNGHDEEVDEPDE